MSNNPNAFPEPGDESLFAIPEAGAGRLSPLEILGGYDEVREGVSYLSGLIRDDGADMCALVVKGIDIQHMDYRRYCWVLVRLRKLFTMKARAWWPQR